MHKTSSSFEKSTKGRTRFLYLLVLDYAFFCSWQRVTLFALVIGLFRDVLGGHLFGVETASLALTGFLLSLGMQKLERDNLWVRLGISFLFVGLTETLSFCLGGWLGVSTGFPFPLIGSIFWSTFYTVALSPVFFLFTNYWFKRIPVLKQYELF